MRFLVSKYFNAEIKVKSLSIKSSTTGVRIWLEIFVEEIKTCSYRGKSLKVDVNKKRHFLEFWDYQDFDARD